MTAERLEQITQLHQGTMKVEARDAAPRTFPKPWLSFSAIIMTGR